MLLTSYYYYGFAALVINEFDQNPTNGPSVLQDLDIENLSKWVCLGVLFGLFVLVQIGQYLCLRLFVREKR